MVVPVKKNPDHKRIGIPYFNSVNRANFINSFKDRYDEYDLYVDGDLVIVDVPDEIVGDVLALSVMVTL